MTTRSFNMGFFGRRPFGSDERKKFYEEWSKMSDQEKLDIINKKMEFFNGDHDRFSIEKMDEFCEKWMSKTYEEKKEFVEEKKKAFHERTECMGNFFGEEKFGFDFHEKEKDSE